MVAALRSHALAALHWPWRAIQAAYLDWLIRSAEGDVAYMQHEIERAAKLPAQIDLHRLHISALRVRRISL